MSTTTTTNTSGQTISLTTPTSTTPTIEDIQDQTMNSITQLESIQNNLYTFLETNSKNNTLSSSQKEEILAKISSLAEMKAKILQNLSVSYDYYQQNVANTQSVLDNQTAALSIANQELTATQAQYNTINQADMNTTRLIYLNTYYDKLYNAYIGVVKTIIILCVILLINYIIFSKGKISTNIASGIAVIVLFIGSIILIRQVYDISRRDTLNFDEYNWNWTPPKTTPTTTSSSSTSTTVSPTTSSSSTSSCMLI